MLDGDTEPGAKFVQEDAVDMEGKEEEREWWAEKAKTGRIGKKNAKRNK